MPPTQVSVSSPRSAAPFPDPEAIRCRVAACVIADFGISADELAFGSRGSPRASLARQVAMYLCHVDFALSFEGIGRLFHRDRTTVAYACRVIEERREDVWFDSRIATLERQCSGVQKECGQ
jgi:chromosomal replication initiation ATPase DnaA